MRKQAGAYVWALVEIMGLEGFYQAVRKEGVIPPALGVADWRHCEGPFLHSVAA